MKLRSTTLSPELQDIQEEVKGYAVDYGLDFYETIFEMLDYDEVNMVAAYGGFPTRYPHWRFGMEYERLSKSYTFGLSKIYEMVINTDPAYAYLLSSNKTVEQKLVMAHVYGHTDFFKNNLWFGHTNRKMIDQMANHATRVRRYMARFGREKVEEFIDVCLSLDNLIDRMQPHIKRRPDPTDVRGAEGEQPPIEVPKLTVDREYMKHYINPPKYVEGELRRIERERDKEKPFPERPERDVMLFLLEHAPLKSWEKDCLALVRDEAYYFSPQGQTKIMNEGWASYWHSKIMTSRALRDHELVDYAACHAGTMGGDRASLNPYKLGIELFRDIEERWDKGKFGKEYDECDDMAERRRWNRRLDKGREKIFQVRRLYNDVTFLDEFFTEDFCREQKLFTFAFNEDRERYEIQSRKFKQVKQQILFQLTNMGQPVIEVVNGNYKNRGELQLRHRFEGVPLKMDHAQATLENVFRCWRRPVSVLTQIENKTAELRFDGTEHTLKA